MIDYAAARTAMVDCQVRTADVTLYPIIAAMLDVPRERFVPAPLCEVAYLGEHLPVADGRVLLDPRVFAKMLDAVEIGPATRVLDIGPGYGYSAAVLIRLAGSVVAVEEHPDLARAARAALSGTGADAVVVETGPHGAGAPDHAPFDVILVNGGVEVIPPAIAAQVSEGGQIVAIFMDGAWGQARVGTRTGDALAWRIAFDAAAPVLSGFQKEQEFAF